MTQNGITASVKRALPWWAKIGAKMVLSRLPLEPRTWQRLGLFSPGGMEDADYARGVFESHLKAAGPLPEGFTYLELGPGDSLATAVIARARGASGGYLIDAGAYASRDIGTYRRLIAELKAGGGARGLSEFEDCRTVDEILEAANCTYWQDGIEALRRVGDECVDFIFSQAALEHVPLGEFADTCRQLYRIQRLGGVASHRIDFQDHLGGSLNSLRFSETLWEAAWFAPGSGFYTNRLRFSEVLDHFQAAGFEVDVRSTRRWDEIPLAPAKLDPAFRDLGKDDLLINGALIGLRKHGG
jgi:hypothetical protein